jgi:Helix-turn-helix domain
MSPLQKIDFSNQFKNIHQRPRHSVWWGPVWRGLFVDPTGKHYRAMGKALWLYGYLIVHADRRAGTLYRRVSTIAQDMQVPERTIQAWLALLRRHSYIRTKTTGRALVIGIEKWRPIIKVARRS